MIRTLLLTSVIALLTSEAGLIWTREGSRSETDQINNIIRFISEVQLYLNNKENSRSRSLLVLPCSLGKVRGLKGVCRNLTKQKIPNALFRLNQFLTRRKKYESKIQENAKPETDEELDSIAENVIVDSQEGKVKDQHRESQENSNSIETTTKVVFPDFSQQTQDVHHDSPVNLDVIGNDFEIETSGESEDDYEDVTEISESVTEQPEHDDSPPSDLLSLENKKFEKLGEEEEFLMNMNEEIEEVFESSGFSLEVNLP